MVKALSYDDFLDIVRTGNRSYSIVKDAPIYRHIFRNLVGAKIIELKGELPCPAELSVADRVWQLDKKVRVLEDTIVDHSKEK